jgi:hypothetical protein
MENNYVQKWITNLIENPTPQAKRMLRGEDGKGNCTGFCCLGDLCETLIECEFPDISRTNLGYKYKDSEEINLLPPQLTQSLGLYHNYNYANPNNAIDIWVSKYIPISILNDRGLRKELLGIILYFTLLTDEDLPEDLELFIGSRSIDVSDEDLIKKYKDSVLKALDGMKE